MRKYRVKSCGYSGIARLKVYKNDPPLQRAGNSDGYCLLEEALQCDIITCHVPLNKGGVDNTVHLLDEAKLNGLKPGTILINSSRGPVVNNSALKQKLMNKKDLHVVLDVWETEPDFDKELLSLIEIGSAHIAGYSLEGKVNGTTLTYNALCHHLNKPVKWQPKLPQVENSTLDIYGIETKEEFFFNLFNSVYPIAEDDNLMRKALNDEVEDVGIYFDKLRKTYRLRRELNNYEIKQNVESEKHKETLEKLRMRFV